MQLLAHQQKYKARVCPHGQYEDKKLFEILKSVESQPAYSSSAVLFYLQSQFLEAWELCSFVVLEVEGHFFCILNQEDISSSDLRGIKFPPVVLNLQGVYLNATDWRDKNIRLRNDQVAALSSFVPLVDSHFEIVSLQTACVDNLLPAKC